MRALVLLLALLPAGCTAEAPTAPATNPTLIGYSATAPEADGDWVVLKVSGPGLRFAWEDDPVGLKFETCDLPSDVDHGHDDGKPRVCGVQRVTIDDGQAITFPNAPNVVALCAAYHEGSGPCEWINGEWVPSD